MSERLEKTPIPLAAGIILIVFGFMILGLAGMQAFAEGHMMAGDRGCATVHEPVGVDQSLEYAVALEQYETSPVFGMRCAWFGEHDRTIEVFYPNVVLTVFHYSGFAWILGGVGLLISRTISANRRARESRVDARQPDHVS